MRMRQALTKSKNLVSIRILQQIGPRYAQEYTTKFGFEAEKHPPFLTMALGAGSVTPWQMVGGYAVFANGGYKVNPYVIAKITDDTGKVLAEAKPLKAGDESNRVIDARNAFIMTSLMNDVTKFGTAAKARTLKRGDLAGKTGTTNDHHDAWFAGYQSTLVGIAWIGFDQPKKMGSRETGGDAALPIWIEYMRVALKGVPETAVKVPEGVVQVGGEYYYREFQAGEGVTSLGLSDNTPEGKEKAEQIKNELF
jgi:penicillin-binding protein 1A